MRSRRYLLVSLAAAVVALAFGASAAWAGPSFTVSASKHKGGPFKTENQSLTINPGKAKDLYWKVRSTGGNPPPHELLFDDAANAFPNPDGFRINWFRKGEKISSEVEGTGYPFNLSVGKPKVFRARVKAVGPGDFCMGGQAGFAEGTSMGDGAYFRVNGNSCG